MKVVTLNGVTFNESEHGEWIVVHIGERVIFFSNPSGRTATQQTMFTGNKQECEAYIESNNLVIDENAIR